MDNEQTLKLTALDRAIASSVGNVIDKDTAFTTIDAERIIETAKKFEEYLKDTKDGK